jgi:tetratricopeptide (TPR) repeat protein
VSLDASSTAPVRADTKPAATTTARAADLFKASVEAYRGGDFERTVALLNEAYTLDPQPVILYNLGRAYEGLGNGEAAIDAYDRYLKADPKATDRASIEQRVATLQRQRDEKKNLESQRDQERLRAQVAAEEQRRAEARAKQRTQEAPRSRSVAPYIVAGLGAAGLVAGAAFGLVANSKHDNAASERVQQTAIDQQDSAKSLATISTISFIAGGVLLAGGVTWWLLDTPPKKTQGSAPTTRVGVSPSFVSLVRSF